MSTIFRRAIESAQVGSPSYVAPEVLRAITETADIWSLGMPSIVCGEPPFMVTHPRIMRHEEGI